MTRREQVLDLLKITKERFTFQEIAQVLSMSVNQITGRINELVKSGLVELAERRRCSITGTPNVKTWRAVQ